MRKRLAIFVVPGRTCHEEWGGESACGIPPHVMPCKNPPRGLSPEEGVHHIIFFHGFCLLSSAILRTETQSSYQEPSLKTRSRFMSGRGNALLMKRTDVEKPTILCPPIARLYPSIAV